MLHALLNSTALPIYPLIGVEETKSYLWHRILVNINTSDLCSVHKLSTGVSKLKNIRNVCLLFRILKAHMLFFKYTYKKTHCVGEIVHFDIVGPHENIFLMEIGTLHVFKIFFLNMPLLE